MLISISKVKEGSLLLWLREPREDEGSRFSGSPTQITPLYDLKFSSFPVSTLTLLEEVIETVHCFLYGLATFTIWAESSAQIASICR